MEKEESAGRSLKRRSPGVQARASGVTTSEKDHEMNSTANATDRNIQAQTAKVIPFRFEARQVRTLLIDDQPWFVAADVAAALGYPAAPQMTRNLDDDEKGMQNLHTLGGDQEMLVINESGLYSAILRSRKAEAKRFKKWVTAEVLPAIRKHGRYEDANNSMGTLLGQTIGTDAAHMLGALIKGKVTKVPTEFRQQATAKIWSQTHTAFGVRSAADIPAIQLDAARNFIAAYALEGEWLAKEPELAGPVLTRADLLNLNALTHYMGRVREIYVRYNMFNALGALGSRAGVELHDYVADGNAVAGSLRSKFKAEIARATADADAAGNRAISGLAAA